MRAKIVNENIVQQWEDKTEPKILDYSEASFKLDKFMPEDPDIQEQYYEILYSDQTFDDKKTELTNFFFENAYEELMYSYFPEGGNIEGFVEYLIKN